MAERGGWVGCNQDGAGLALAGMGKKKDIPLTFKRLTEMIYTLSAATLISKKLLYEIKSGQYK